MKSSEENFQKLREHPDMADLFCSASKMLARYITRARRECKAHASRTHYLFHAEDALQKFVG